MKGKVSEILRICLLCTAVISFLVVITAGTALACATLPAWDKDGDFFISGIVGIGTREPADPLHIRKISPTINLDNLGTVGNEITELLFSDRLNPMARLYWSKSDDKIYLQNLLPAPQASPFVVLDNAGNFGIGTASPQAMLHVAGDVIVDGNLGAKYQDLAEWVKSTYSLTPGTVVMIDTEKVDHVMPSDKSYNTLVAGVVSNLPGILLGVPSEGKTKIAHTGRVKVKVDTSYGKISVGDLLVTSPVKGYAMKADSDMLKPGMLLGKALESLEEGQKGEVLVLITLQ